MEIDENRWKTMKTMEIDEKRKGGGLIPTRDSNPTRVLTVTGLGEHYCALLRGPGSASGTKWGVHPRTHTSHKYANTLHEDLRLG